MYWSNDAGVSHRLVELGADARGGELASATNGSDATSAAGFDWSHFTFNNNTSAVSSNAPTHVAPSSESAASSAPIDTITSAAPLGHPSEAAPTLMLAGDLGSFAVSNAGSGGTGSASGSGGTLVSGSSGSSGLVINVVFDASCANAPPGFEAGVEAVVSYFESHFSNPITITIDVGYGEVDGQPLGFGALAESATVLTSVSYSALEAALVANADAIGIPPRRQTYQLLVLSVALGGSRLPRLKHWAYQMVAAAPMVISGLATRLSFATTTATGCR